MKRLRSLPHKLVLATEVLLVYGRVRVLLLRHGLPAVLARLRAAVEGEDATAQGATLARAIVLARATQRTLALVPWNSRCLMQSLVLTGLLARRGVRTEFLIAVKPGQSLDADADGFAAHAWIEYMGRPLLPSFPDAFQTLVRL